MTRYRTLVVAPKTDLLFVDDEVQQVINLMEGKVLQGSQANIHGLLHILDEPFDILWFATHGDEKGVYLSDGILSTSEITTLARSAGVQLVVLNTCSSRAIALGIYDELRIRLVCTLKKVPDRAAFITATVFARKIKQGLSFRQAFEAAKPGQNTTYLFLPEKETSMPPVDKKRVVEDDMSSLVVLVNRLYEIVITGNADYGTEGLIPIVKKLSEQVDQVVDDLDIMRQNQEFNRRILLIETIVLIFLFISTLLLLYLFSQRGG